MNFLVKLTLLVCIFFSLKFGVTPWFEIYTNYFLVLLLFPILLFKYLNIATELSKFFLLLFIVGSYYVLTGDNEPKFFFKVWIGTFMFYLLYDFIIKYYNFNINEIFKIYLYGAILSSWVAVFQMFSYLLNFKLGYDFSYLGVGYGNYNSANGFFAFFTEPAHFSAAMSPAIFVAVSTLVLRKKEFITYFQSVLIITAIILSTSSTGLISIFVSLFLVALRRIKISIFIFSAIIGIFFGKILYDNIPKFQNRVDSSLAVINDGEDIDINNVEGFGSSMVLYNHWQIATTSFSKHPLFGTGLGSHFIASERYTTMSRFEDIASLNKEDACSLFLRLLSETGIIGLAILTLYLVRYYIGNTPYDDLWIISKSCLVYIFSNLLRNGHYFLYGFPLFVLMYYYVYQNNRKKIHNKDIFPNIN